MSVTLTVAVLLFLSLAGFWLGRNRAVAIAGGRIANLHSVPVYYGSYMALWAGLPALEIGRASCRERV